MWRRKTDAAPLLDSLEQSDLQYLRERRFRTQL
jgi:hypothetical protein